MSEHKKRSWSRQGLIKYIVLQLPALLFVILIMVYLYDTSQISLWLGSAIILIWLVKDVVLFPLVWRAYETNIRENKKLLIGKRGITRERLAPSGYVTVNGELWKAKVANRSKSIGEGEPIIVKEQHGRILIVDAVSSEVEMMEGKASKFGNKQS